VNITRAYKTALDLNDKQTTACKRHAGAARFAYNWGLARKQEAYAATGKSPSAIDLHRDTGTQHLDDDLAFKRKRCPDSTFRPGSGCGLMLAHEQWI